MTLIPAQRLHPARCLSSLVRSTVFHNLALLSASSPVAHIPATSLGASSLSLPRAPSRLRPTILGQNAANPRRLHLSRPIRAPEPVGTATSKRLLAIDIQTSFDVLAFVGTSRVLNNLSTYITTTFSSHHHSLANDLTHSTARRNVDRALGNKNGLRLGPETPHLRALAQLSLANLPVVPPKARYLQKRGVLSLRQRAPLLENPRVSNYRWPSLARPQSSADASSV
ncbi:hypothetical protein CNYM01_00551 [Colletotrichum nymphaeae SA-01]|uniref:Uncharacterized protein n=1 Tax=Colletotrichum nymphaeae SA-01 TaxID=1460502 RepID=A0A135S388_9PEZI|nr:hypothetical protein CNYM01_00551 [Colletotrichum nymphaeae SA-01]